MSDGHVAALILAAGSGSRFGGQKQFETVRGQRLVDRVVTTASSVCDEVVVVLPAGLEWDGPPVAAAVPGAHTRSASVRCGLAAISSAASIIVTHDPAHPLVTPGLIRKVIEEVRRGADVALPAVRLVDPLKLIDGARVVRTVSRHNIVMAQMPHAFRAEILRAAHADGAEALEDTALVEKMGGAIVVVPGDARNVHVTTPEDLEIVARLLDD